MLASLMGSFAGGGSSMILLPLLLLTVTGSYLDLLIITKIGAVVMSGTAAVMHFRKTKMEKKLFGVLILMGILGTGLGTYFLQYQSNEEFFRLLLGVMMLLTALYLIFMKSLGLGESRQRKINAYSLGVTSVFAFFLNILNGLMGGTGLILTFYLVAFMRLSFVEAIAYTMISYTLVSSLQVTYLLVSEGAMYLMLPFVIGGAMIGSYAGTQLQYLKGSLWVKRVAILMMIVIGVKMLGLF